LIHPRRWLSHPRRWLSHPKGGGINRWPFTAATIVANASYAAGAEVGRDLNKAHPPKSTRIDKGQARSVPEGGRGRPRVAAPAPAITQQSYMMFLKEDVATPHHRLRGQPATIGRAPDASCNSEGLKRLASCVAGGRKTPRPGRNPLGRRFGSG